MRRTLGRETPREVRNLRFIAPIADRILSAIVPRATAGACCPPDPYLVACTGCYRGYSHQYVYEAKTCSYNCACQVSCGGCNTLVPC
jgi:hypothetical protein